MKTKLISLLVLVLSLAAVSCQKTGAEGEEGFRYQGITPTMDVNRFDATIAGEVICVPFSSIHYSTATMVVRYGDAGSYTINVTRPELNADVSTCLPIRDFELKNEKLKFKVPFKGQHYIRYDLDGKSCTSKIIVVLNRK